MKLTVHWQSLRDLLLENVFISEAQWKTAAQEAAKKRQRILDVLVQSGQLSPALGQKILKAGLLIAEGQSLLQLGLSSAEEINKLLAQLAAGPADGGLVTLLVERALLPPDTVERTIETLGSGVLSQGEQVPVSPFLLELIPTWILEKQCLLPMYRLERHLLLAMVNPDDLPLLDDLRAITQHEVVGFQATEAVIHNQLRGVLSRPEVGLEDRIADAVASVEVEVADGISGEDLDAHLDDDAPVVRIVDSILVQALIKKASDIHFEPKDDKILVRLRVDGLLQKMTELPVHLKAMVASRLKIMSKLDIAEKRVPQDGRARLRIEGRVVDFRVSTLPCTQGEKVVMRILDKSSSTRRLSQMGFDPASLRAFEEMVHHNHGIVYVTGPTGSGKTTTLYAALNSLEDPTLNVITVEDPVESELDWATQVSINPAQGLTFARVLRAILRQDPDVILLGETRDEETARIAVEAALTGHLVLTTLHANGAPQAVTRLIEMGIEPFLVGAAVVGVVAQRLIRTICPLCKDTYAPDAETLAFLGLENEPQLRFFQGTGCDTCQESGYLARRGIYEVMLINDPLREAIVRNASATELRQIALANGMSTLLHSAIQLLREEATTVEEVLRVVFVKETKEKRCPHCRNVVDDTYVRCPFCQNVLKLVCITCRRELDPGWSVCPGCGTHLIAESNLCHRCLSQMKPDWTACLNCGAPRQEAGPALVNRGDHDFA